MVTTTGQYMLVTTTGTYVLEFSSGVALPTNGQQITVYGGLSGGLTGTCTSQPQYCVVGTITVITWQPA
jgi:hypothetical protein